MDLVAWCPLRLVLAVAVVCSSVMKNLILHACKREHETLHRYHEELIHEEMGRAKHLETRYPIFGRHPAPNPELHVRYGVRLEHL